MSSQSSPSSYESYTKEALAEAKAARQRSEDLRSTLSGIFTNSIKDLRQQAARVDVVLEDRVKLTEESCLHLEKELLQCLHELAETEKIIEELRSSTRGLDNAMKLTQTRLASRLQRRNVESCRDAPQFA